MKTSRRQISNPDKLISYFKDEYPILTIVSITGILYNVGLLAGPWFEGRLAQCLYNVITGASDFGSMIHLAFLYVIAITFVQGMRFIKRFYVRRFSNHVDRTMKSVLYGNLIHKSEHEINSEDTGDILTKAISDVDATAEGMRKFVTEFFDTGIALISYATMLFYYDWRLALVSMFFPPVSAFIAEKMKVVVERSARQCKQSMGELNAATLDRASGAITYRVFGVEHQRNEDYEKHLSDYENKAIKANIWVSSLQPMYSVISTSGVFLILFLGAKNVLGSGWTNWDIGILATFLSCYTRLAVKSSHVAKLFNAVQKAEVSWSRIRPLMKNPPVDPGSTITIHDGANENIRPCKLEMRNVSLSRNDGCLFKDLNLSAHFGQIIGITGPVACGKSSLGQIFTGEIDYKGSILINGVELRDMNKNELYSECVWLGHDPALLSDSIKNNVLMGDYGNIDYWLRETSLDKEVSAMEDKVETPVGVNGVRLSGGQQARVALARTLSHGKSIIVLDDPFAALDRNTENEIFANLKSLGKNSIVLLISHRLYLFDEVDQVIWIDEGAAVTAKHEELLKNVEHYRKLYEIAQKGSENA